MTTQANYRPTARFRFILRIGIPRALGTGLKDTSACRYRRRYGKESWLCGSGRLFGLRLRPNEAVTDVLGLTKTALEGDGGAHVRVTLGVAGAKMYSRRLIAWASSM